MALVEAFLPNSKASLTVAAGAAAVSTALPPGETIEVQNAATGTVFFELGTAITAAVAATGVPVLQNGFRQFRRPPGVTHISIIAPSGTGSVYLTGGAGAIGSRLRSRGKSAGGPSGPVAIFDAPLITTLVPNRAGDPTFTFTRATTAYVADNEGILRNAIANEARFQGARRVRNLHTTSSELLTTGWTNNGTPTKTSDPDVPSGTGITQSTKVVTNSAFQGPYQNVLPVGRLCTKRVWLKGGAGGEVVGITDNGNTGGTVTLTNSWVLYSKTWTTVDAASGVLVSNPGTVYIAGIQTEEVGGASNTAPGDYVSVGVLAAPYHGAGVDGCKAFATTNGNSVAANVVTEAAGTAIPAATTLGYVAENQATNLCLQSQTFDNASWNKEDAVITANTQAAPDGSLTADTFTDNANNIKHDIYIGSIGVTAAPQTFSLYLKAGTLTWAQLAIYDPATPHWANFNLVTGALGFAAAGVTQAITALPNGWYRCSITFTTASAAGGVAQITSLNANTNAATPPYVGTGQTMYLWGAQVEAASDASSYVPTTTAAVTRNTDQLQYPMVSNISGALATTYSETYLPTALAGRQQTPVTLDATGSFPQYYGGAKTLGLFMTSGGATSANARILGAVNKNASAWSGTTVSVCLNGGVVATGTFAAVANSGTVSLGSAYTNSLDGFIRNVRFYATRLTDAQIQTMTS